jgi:hypothetical protein
MRSSHCPSHHPLANTLCPDGPRLPGLTLTFVIAFAGAKIETNESRTHGMAGSREGAEGGNGDRMWTKRRKIAEATFHQIFVGHAFSAIVHFYRPIFPLTDQRFGFRRLIAPVLLLELQKMPPVRHHPIVADRWFRLQSENLSQLRCARRPNVIVLCPPRTCAQTAFWALSRASALPAVGCRLSTFFQSVYNARGTP